MNRAQRRKQMNGALTPPAGSTLNIQYGTTKDGKSVVLVFSTPVSDVTFPPAEAIAFAQNILATAKLCNG